MREDVSTTGPCRSSSASQEDADVIFAEECRPAKAGMFGGRHESHRVRVMSHVAWIAFIEETKWMNPIDKAILGIQSNGPLKRAA